MQRPYQDHYAPAATGEAAKINVIQRLPDE